MHDKTSFALHLNYRKMRTPDPYDLYETVMDKKANASREYRKQTSHPHYLDTKSARRRLNTLGHLRSGSGSHLLEENLPLIIGDECCFQIFVELTPVL